MKQSDGSDGRDSGSEPALNAPFWYPNEDAYCKPPALNPCGISVIFWRALEVNWLGSRKEYGELVCGRNARAFSEWLSRESAADMESPFRCSLSPSRLASSMYGLFSDSESSFHSAPSLLLISELCILGFSCAIFLLWPRDQTMKAFMGLLM
ncbi:hypothetical protein EYF80_050150 [Liparis tanakae]|uniref:Uncharacterized protein n=1 Tax=Liparis tanakae TaxID=230148 RepID=A0A4Z2FFY7_9TELE|nr:hypothetical protein EYF80_050150 [Liparis tanakae]